MGSIIDPASVGIFTFRVLNLDDTDSQLAVKYGDRLWLQIAEGTGITIVHGRGFPDWKRGSVVAARVKKSTNMLVRTSDATIQLN